VYDAYVQATGAILPRISPPAQRQYKVPVRFGMAAIVALLTTFGVVFGVLKYIEAPPEVYLFVASEIAAVCLVQIMFGSMPRGASILTGAVLLPFWMTIYLRSPPNWMTPGMVAMCYLFCFVFGGLLGYCLGALAAGFFLVMDLVDSALAVGGQTEHVASAPAENAHLSRPDQALLASDLATQSLIGAGDSASATTQPGDWVREYLQNNRR
jgi:hypothetical protein